MQKNSQKIQGLEEISKQYEYYFFDMDGVIWSQDKLLNNAIEIYDQLISKNKQVFFVTNINSRSRQQVKEKLEKFGFKNTQLENIFTASSISAQYLITKHPEIKKCYVIGMQGICLELKAVGIEYLDSNQVHIEGPQLSEQVFANINIENDNIDAVLLGLDFNFNFRKICYASLYIKNGAQFFATNYDTHIRVGERFMPANAILGEAIAKSVGKQPYIMGKPNPFIIEYVINKNQFQKEKCLMIGDNLETDIQFGINAGIDQLLVLTGVTNQELLDQNIQQNKIIPTYYSEFL